MKRLTKLTFMSWLEEGRDGSPIRAIALCENNWFCQAINTARDSDMGEKDGMGVYSRIWYQDNINNADVTDVRPATSDEVELYLKYCPLGEEEQYGSDRHEKIVAMIESYERTDVLIRYERPSWIEKVIDRLFHRNDLPF